MNYDEGMAAVFDEFNKAFANGEIEKFDTSNSDGLQLDLEERYNCVVDLMLWRNDIDQQVEGKGDLADSNLPEVQNFLSDLSGLPAGETMTVDQGNVRPLQVAVFNYLIEKFFETGKTLSTKHDIGTGIALCAFIDLEQITELGIEYAYNDFPFHLMN